MRPTPAAVILAALAAATLAAQAPTTPGAPPAPSPPPPGLRRAVQPMTLSSSAWPDGGVIPVAHTQVGGEQSPPLTWSDVPDGVQSFVLLVHDVDAAVGDGTDDVLHWLVWNIPGDVRALAAGVPHGTSVAGAAGAGQISATAPGYRGPGASAAGPVHHYLVELFALDAPLPPPPAAATPPQTRAAVIESMKGHVRGKAAYVGRFRRGLTP